MSDNKTSVWDILQAWVWVFAIAFPITSALLGYDQNTLTFGGGLLVFALSIPVFFALMLLLAVAVGPGLHFILPGCALVCGVMLVPAHRYLWTVFAGIVCIGLALGAAYIGKRARKTSYDGEKYAPFLSNGSLGLWAGLVLVGVGISCHWWSAFVQVGRLQRLTDQPAQVALVPDGNTAIGIETPGRVYLNGLKEQKELRQLDVVPDSMRALALGGNAKFLLGVGQQSLFLWDLDSGSLLSSQGLGERQLDEFAPVASGRQTLCARNSKLWLLNLISGDVREFEDSSDNIRSVVATPDGQFACTTHVSGVLAIWDISTGKRLRQSSLPTTGLCLSASPQNNMVVAGGAEGDLYFCSVYSGNVERTIKAHKAAVLHVTIAPDGLRVLSCSLDKTVALTEIPTGKVLGRFLGHRATTYQAAFGADGQTATSFGQDKFVRRWRLPKS